VVGFVHESFLDPMTSSNAFGVATFAGIRPSTVGPDLVSILNRYLVVATLAGVTGSRKMDARAIEPVPRNVTTDFGAPAIPTACEEPAGTATQRTRCARLVGACCSTSTPWLTMPPRSSERAR
jgi:hypothetical protein